MFRRSVFCRGKRGDSDEHAGAGPNLTDKKVTREAHDHSIKLTQYITCDSLIICSPHTARQTHFDHSIAHPPHRNTSSWHTKVALSKPSAYLVVTQAGQNHILSTLRTILSYQRPYPLAIRSDWSPSSDSLVLLPAEDGRTGTVDLFDREPLRLTPRHR